MRIYLEDLGDTYQTLVVASDLGSRLPVQVLTVRIHEGIETALCPADHMDFYWATVDRTYLEALPEVHPWALSPVIRDELEALIIAD